MLNTIFGIVGWIGTLLVFAGVAIRLFRPEWDQYAYWAAIAGLVCVGLYTLSQWREIGRSFQKRETKLGAMTSISVIAVLAILIGINWAGRAAATSGGISRRPRRTRCRTRPSKVVQQPESAGEGAGLRRARRLSALPRLRSASYEYCEPEHSGRVRRRRSRAGARARIRRRRTTARSSWSTTAAART